MLSTNHGAIWAALTALLLSGAASAAPVQPTPELQALAAALPGTLINDPTRLDWDVFGPDHASKAIRNSASPGGGALQITVPHKGATLFEIGTNAPLTAGIQPGQRITVAFYARTLKADTPSGEGVIGVRFQQNAAPYPGFGDTRLAIGSEWRLYEVSAIADRTIGKGEAIVSFQLSGAKQTIEIGQTIVVEGASSIVPKSGNLQIPTPVMPLQLAGKGNPINDPANIVWQFYGAAAAHKTVAARGMPGDSAMQFSIAAAGANIFDSGATVPVTAAVAQGDILIVAVLARCISADTPDGLGKIGIRFQQNSPPYPGFGDHVLAIGPNWKLYQIKTQAKIDIARGEAAVALQLGGAKQVIEIGRVYVLNGAMP